MEPDFLDHLPPRHREHLRDLELRRIASMKRARNVCLLVAATMLLGLISLAL